MNLKQCVKYAMGVLCALFFVNLAHAQDAPQQTDLQVFRKVPAAEMAALANVSPESVDAALASIDMDFTYAITLTDTTDIASIQVKLGSTDGGSEHFSKTFTFDGAATNPDGTTYRREGFYVYLGIGTYNSLNTFFAEAQIEDNSGNLSPALNFAQ